MPNTPTAADATAKLMLIVLSISWGLTWPAMKSALIEIPPFSMRSISLSLGAAALLIVVRLQGRSFRLGRLRDWGHVAVASLLNIVGFTMLAAFALMMTATSRTTILAYTMPVWAALFAWMVLGERLDRARTISLALCISGIAVLIYPLWQGGIPFGLVLAVATGVSWAAGTVYLKWARIEGDPTAITAWQLVMAAVFVTVCLPFVEGGLHVAQAHAPALFGMIFTGLVGSAFAYFLWFRIIGRLDATTASLGILMVPVIGVVMNGLVLGEWPSLADLLGFVLIFAASACVLLPSKTVIAPEPS